MQYLIWQKYAIVLRNDMQQSLSIHHVSCAICHAHQAAAQQEWGGRYAITNLNGQQYVIGNSKHMPYAICNMPCAIGSNTIGVGGRTLEHSLLSTNGPAHITYPIFFIIFIFVIICTTYPLFNFILISIIRIIMVTKIKTNL